MRSSCPFCPYSTDPRPPKQKPTRPESVAPRVTSREVLAAARRTAEDVAFEIAHRSYNE
jgi:hypothetical protein